MKERLFSGCAPSGNLTIGNYIGALKQWTINQEEYDSLFCIVDMHAITAPQEPELLRKRSLDFLALYVACGMDPDKSCIFVQSQNPHHAELSWILSCLTNFGELGRMTQFKSKSEKHGVTAGLLTYPILMAADLLLYGTHLVPVGEDQKQHLELARDLAKRFNKRYEDLFVIPEPFIPEKTGRIMNLQDPASKMRKSHENPNTYISLLDTPEEVRRKIRKAKTDSQGSFNLEEENSGIGNLVNIYSALTGCSCSTVLWEYENQGYGLFKNDLSEIICEFLKPIQKRFYTIRDDQDLMNHYMDLGKEKSLEKSEPMMEKVKKTIGFL